ncbi:hypothetical protein ColLi_11430 [Colletotrichum liriopes]|uniref:Uncharacterized protein n=1 Tax=Colletotrichum liriopes TaxID=708192 RepID=A0AA37GYD3_9PEZI|nr:hypothetical protein ColLi_11430 [Colletotrichum liriopes]
MASKLLEDTGGTDLDGFISPDRIAMLFWKISEPCHRIAEENIEHANTLCKRYFMEVTRHIFAKPDSDRKLYGGKLSDGSDNAEKVASD